MTLANEFIGGCKEHATYGGIHSTMKCKATCPLHNVGRDRMNRFKWTIETEFSSIATITVNNKKLGWPTSEDPYIGMMRFDRRYCGESLLSEIEKRGKYLIDIGDRSNSNYWLESISFIGVEQKLWKKALFVQFRRGEPTDNDMTAKVQDRDQVHFTHKSISNISQHE